MVASHRIGNLTWADLIRRVAAQSGVVDDLTDDEVDFILWNRTPFPMGSYEEVLAAAIEFFQDDGTTGGKWPD